MIKKIVSTLLAILLLVVLMGQTVFGANNVSDIHVDVVLYEDGSAYITQTWNANFNEGTEGYIPIENLNGMSIEGFMVSDENGPYTYKENWNIQASFEEKIGRYGIVTTPRGYELCWGITEYGQKRYAIEYKINHFVGAYDDFDGFNFQFINPGMGTFPTDVTVKIVMQDGTALDTSNAAIWAFGFMGEINFENGQVVAYTDRALSGTQESVIIMMQLNKGLIAPTRVIDGSFEEVKTEAFKGSDYGTGDGGSSAETPAEKPGLLAILMGTMIPALIIVIITSIMVQIGRKNKKIKNLYKNAEYYREAPLEGNMEATFTLARDFNQVKDDGNLIGAAFLKLISTGCLEPIGETTTTFFGREKESISLKLVHPPDFPGVTTEKLYDLIVSASGSDQILQEKELEKYSKVNYKGIMAIINEAKEDGESTLVDMKTYDGSKKAKVLGLSERGEALLSNIMGFKKYLLEFSLIGERSIKESVIWQDYLTFAALLGIADKAIEEFKKVYPEAASEAQYGPNAYGPNAYIYYYLLSTRFSRASYNAAQTAQAARTAGGGGRASFGGGGGFGGGGFGGGAR